MSATVRYASVDALRGLAVAAKLLVNNPAIGTTCTRRCATPKWHGCTPTDLIFRAAISGAGTWTGISRCRSQPDGSTP